MNLKILKKKKYRRETADEAINTEVKSSEAPRESQSSWLSDLRYGRTISISVFKKNAWILMLILVVVISMMGLRYKTKTKMLEIKRLEKELAHARSEKLNEKADYMSLIRETEMERMVNERGLGLVFQEQPPYEVTACEPAPAEQNK